MKPEIKLLIYKKIGDYGECMFGLGKAQYQHHGHIYDEKLFNKTKILNKEIMDLLNNKDE